MNDVKEMSLKRNNKILLCDYETVIIRLPQKTTPRFLGDANYDDVHLTTL